MERISSGRPRLDEILGGGLPANAINLIAGLPGTGKTMLAQLYVFQNATAERPAVYLTTASEPLEKMIRYGQELTFFDPGAIGHRVFYEDLGGFLQDGGLDAALGRIADILRERQPGILVIDSFKCLSAFATASSVFRRFVTALAGRLSAVPMTTFWIGEYGPDELAGGPEFAVADSILVLRTDRTGLRITRTLEVEKLRGSAFRSGEHAYRLAADGLHVFPRLVGPVDEPGYEVGTGRISIGLDALDEMLEGGLLSGSTTLVGGPSGSGKTMLGLHFLAAGVRAGEAVLMATLQEDQAQIERARAGFDFGGAGRLEVLHRSPVDLYLDEWVWNVIDTAERISARRLVIDSLSDFQVRAGDEIRLQESVYSLSQRCARAGITMLYTLETEVHVGVGPTSAYAVSHLSDNLIVLLYDRENGSLGRAIAVKKTRATGHSMAIWRFEITARGLDLVPIEHPAAS